MAAQGFSRSRGILPPDRRVYTGYRQISQVLLAILQGADPDGLPHRTGSPHRRIGLVQKLFRIGAVVRTGDNAGRNRDPQATSPLKLIELTQQPLSHLHPFNRLQVRSKHTDRILLQPKGFIDDPNAVPQRRPNDRKHCLLPHIPRFRPRTRRIKDSHPKRMPIPPIRLQ